MDEEVIKKMVNDRLFKKTITIIIAAAIVMTLGLIAINQGMGYYYKSELLQAPCTLCLELNPEIDEQCFIKRESITPGTVRTWETNLSNLTNLLVP